uniref:Uncharacterized protein n=1 Tax=Panagrolaimus sp. PS1159 TaxID=55785 RepID=A0AC35FEJ0_9BILA
MKNLRIIKSGVFNFKQKFENSNVALFRVCSNNGKCLGEITFCYLTNSNTNATSFCQVGQNGLQFQMKKDGLFHSNENIGLVEWEGTSCALFGYLNEKIIFGTSYLNFSLSSEKMDFQKLPDSTFNQFLVSLNLPNECSIEPIDSFILIRKTTEIQNNEKAATEKKIAEAEFEISDLIFLLYIAVGIFGIFDLIFGILIIIAIILEKRKAKKERKKELEERLKVQAAVIAFEARKLEREKQRKKRKQKLQEEGLVKTLKHVNTKSEKLVIETRPQKLYVPDKEKNLESDFDESKKKEKRRKKRQNNSEKQPSKNAMKKAEKTKTPKILAIKGNSIRTSHVSESESQSKPMSSAVSGVNNNVKK